MKKNLNHLEKFRIRSGPMGSTAAAGANGAFLIKVRGHVPKFFVIVSDGFGWEHVSVSVAGEERTPTWGEMCMVKDLFWDDEEMVVQYHPAKSEYINCHPFVLHLWKPIDVEIPRPPSFMIGPKGIDIETTRRQLGETMARWRQATIINEKK